MRYEHDIGLVGVLDYPEFYARSFRPLREEIKLMIKLARPRFRHSPRVASLKITDACNFKCDYCTSSRKPGKPLTTKELFRVEDCLAEAGTQFNDLTGGEGTLRGDLSDLIEHSAKLGMVTTINSNGGIRKETLKEEYSDWRERAEAGLFGAFLSLDGIGEKNDPRILHLAKSLVNPLRLYAGVRTVVTQDNLDKIYEIGRVCMLNDVFFQAVPVVALGGESSAAANDNFHPLNAEGRLKYIQIMKELAKVRGPLAKLLRVENSYLKQVVNPSRPIWHCHDPASHWLFIDAEGNARVCNDRALPQKFSLIADTNPLLTREFRQAVGEESKKCEGCSWYCNWEANRAQLFRGIADLRLYLTIASLT